MGGVDTVRGINFQHCHALLTALDVAADPSLVGIRVEGTVDVLDLEIHAAGSTSAQTVVVRGMQMKSRQQGYTWAKSELLAIVRRWASLPVSESSAFALHTDGELGPSGQAVAAALDAARRGDAGQIAAFLGVATTDPLCAIAAKATIVSEPGTVESLLLAAEREVRALLPGGPQHPDAAKEATDRVNTLFRLISTRSGCPNPDERMILREELLDVLGGIGQLPASDRWADALGAEYVSVAADEDISSLVLPTLRAGWDDKCLTIGELSALVGTLLLTGRTGSGKSTVGRLWRATGARAGQRVVICHAETYTPQQLDRAVAHAVGDLVGRDLMRIVGRHVLGDPETTVVIDGVSEIPSQFRLELAKELQVHLAVGHTAHVVLIGRDEVVSASLLPPTQAPFRLYPEAFGHKERLDLTEKVLTKPNEAPAADGSSDTSDHDLRVALAQAEHALGDAAGNPMLLGMALELVANGATFSDRASIYELTVNRMAARTNAGDVRIASAALGIVFARLLDEGRRYANPLEWARLFEEAVAALNDIGVAHDATEIRSAIERSGVVNAVLTGIGQTRLHVPVHDSFADYFAARAHADGLVSLPNALTENDESRILLGSQMQMLRDDECLVVATQLPFTLVRLSESDQRPMDDQTPSLVAALLDAVLPGSAPAHVTMWNGEDGVVAQLGTGATEWIDPDGAPDLFAGLTAIGGVSDGPTVIAVRLWRLALHQLLRKAPWLRPPSPQSCDDARDQLTAHSRAMSAAVERIAREVVPESAAERLARTIGPQGMTGVVYKRQDYGMRGEGWPVRFRRTPHTRLVTAADEEPPPGPPTEEFTSFADVDSVLSTSPEAAAAKHVTDAINQLTRNHWL